MDAAAPTDGTAPDKGTDAVQPEEGVANAMDSSAPGASPAVNGEEVKTDAAATKPAADAKKPAAAAAPATVSYTPILDSEVTTVGICNKAHKASVNLIQVLYCKAVGNAMM